MRTLLIISALVIAAIATDCPMCTPEQCARTECTIGTNPYACLAGEAAGGCGPNNSSWRDPGICSECCKVDTCILHCTSCSNQECAKYTCPDTEPYACTQGKAAGGCGSAASWANTPLCKKCCSTAFCPKPTEPTSVPRYCPPCPKEVCARRPLPCPSNLPGVCLEGGSKGGCSTAQGFSNSSSCSSCCDSTNCYSNPSYNCNHDCGIEMCHSKKRCQVNQPYMCTVGEDTYGCSDSATFWPTLPSGCSACCDVRKCVIPCASQCTAAECINFYCAARTPFVCTAGPQSQQCNDLPNYWPESPSCYRCCDFRSCNAVKH